MKKKLLSAGLTLALFVSCLVTPAVAQKSGIVDMEKQFAVKGTKMTVNEDAVQFTLTQETATIRYVRPLATAGFSFRINGVDDKEKKLEKISMKLTDIEDEACSICVNLGQLNDENTAVKLNSEGRTYLTAGSMYKKNKMDIALVFNENQLSFSDDQNAYTMQVETCENGTSFDGFPSMGVTMELTVTGKAGATFDLKTINNQNFGESFRTDRVEPVLCIPNMKKSVLKDSVVELMPAAAYDVLSDNVTLKLTVQDAQSNIVEDINGTKLDKVDGTKVYQVKLTEYGQYRISYVASDGENKTRNMGYQMTVKDAAAPNITLVKTFEQTVKVGEEFIFPEVEVEDNAKGDITTYVTVKAPNGVITREKDKFVPQTEGVYTITFSALDASGNIGRYQVEICAEGGSNS